jgi:hypothetical protein
VKPPLHSHLTRRTRPRRRFDGVGLDARPQRSVFAGCPPRRVSASRLAPHTSRLTLRRKQEPGAVTGVRRVSLPPANRLIRFFESPIAPPQIFERSGTGQRRGALDSPRIRGLRRRMTELQSEPRIRRSNVGCGVYLYRRKTLSTRTGEAAFARPGVLDRGVVSHSPSYRESR